MITREMPEQLFVAHIIATESVRGQDHEKFLPFGCRHLLEISEQILSGHCMCHFFTLPILDTV